MSKLNDHWRDRAGRRDNDGIDVELDNNGDIIITVNSDVTALINDPDGGHRPRATDFDVIPTGHDLSTAGDDSSTDDIIDADTGEPEAARYHPNDEKLQW